MADFGTSPPKDSRPGSGTFSPGGGTGLSGAGIGSRFTPGGGYTSGQSFGSYRRPGSPGLGMAPTSGSRSPGLSRGLGSPGLGAYPSLSASSPETADISRRAAEWEQQIETLDQKEMEIHQSQLRLIREQTATFRGELSFIRQELDGLKAQVADHQSRHQEIDGKHSDIYNLLDKDRADRDAAFNELARELPNHRKEIERMRDEVDAHSALHAQHNAAIQGFNSHAQHHATLPERIGYIEKVLGDNADKHERAQAMMEQMHAHLSNTEALHKHAATMEQRVSFLEKTIGDNADKHMKELQALKDSHARHMDATKGQSAEMGKHVKTVATLEDRMGYLEKQVGESADKHMRELDQLKSAHGKMGGHHASIGERMAYIENLLGDNADKHQRAMEEADSKIANQLRRLENCENVGDQIKKLHQKLASEKDALHQHHAGLEERVAFLEKTTGDSADKHSRELKALREQHLKHVSDVKGAQGQREQAHASIEDRLEYMEKIVGDSADKHANLVRDLGAAQKAHKDNSKDLQARADHHASLEERLKYMEKIIGDSADKHEKALAAAHAKLDQMNRSVESDKRQREGAGKSLEDKHAMILEKHASIEDRIEKLEGVLRDSSGMEGIKKDQKMLREQYMRLESWLASFHPTGEALKR